MNGLTDYSNITMENNCTNLSNDSGGSNGAEISFSGLSPVFTNVIVAILCIIIITAMLFNTLLISMILLVKKLHTLPNVLIINLAIGDLLLLIVLFFDVDQFIRNYFAYDITMCELTNTVFFLSLPASAVNLCLLTGERFLTLQYPFNRHEMFTKRRIICVFVVCWIYTIVTASLPIMGWRPQPTTVQNGTCYFYFDQNFSIFMVVCNFFLPLLTILGLNIKIFAIANDNVRRMRRLSARKKKHESAFAGNIKAAKRILLLVGLFLLCWLTYILTVVVNIMCLGCVPREVVWAANVLNYSSSAINPILYGLLNREIRNRSWDLVRRILQSCGIVAMKTRKSPYLCATEVQSLTDGEKNETHL